MGGSKALAGANPVRHHTALNLALGGATTVENLCLMCGSHNLHRARRVFDGRSLPARKSGQGSGRVRELVPVYGGDGLRRGIRGSIRPEIPARGRAHESG